MKTKTPVWSRIRIRVQGRFFIFKLATFDWSLDFLIRHSEIMNFALNPRSSDLTSNLLDFWNGMRCRSPVLRVGVLLFAPHRRNSGPSKNVSSYFLTWLRLNIGCASENAPELRAVDPVSNPGSGENFYLNIKSYDPQTARLNSKFSLTM